jgi:MFS family permease
MLIIAGSLHVPAWVSWMGDLVTTNRGKYFGMRNMVCGIVVIASMLIAGTVLDLFKDNINLFIGFVVLFSIAFFSRALSSYLFTKKYEPKFVHEHKYYFSFMEFIKKMRHNNFGRFVIFVSIFHFATSFAGPFFAVYMLNNLGYSYVFFTIVTISFSLGYFLIMPLLGRLADKYGTLKILKLGCLLICLSPFLWLPVIFAFPADSLILLFCISVIKFLTGIGWAGVSLGTGNFLYEAVTQQRRVICSAYNNIIISFGSFFGALLGGFVIYLNISLAWMTIFPLVFLVSGILRIIAYIFFSRSIKEVRICERFNIKKFKVRLTALRLFNRS